MALKLFDKLFSRRSRRFLVITSVFILFIALLFFLLRGPYLSNTIKRAVLPVLEDATGERIIMDKAVINLFPFYFQAKGLKVFDKQGNRLLHVTKLRAYIDVIGLFSKEIRVRRLTVKEPELTTDIKVLEKVIDHIGEYTAGEDNGHFRVTLKGVQMTDGKFAFTDLEKQVESSGQGLYVDMLIKDSIDIRMSLKDGWLKIPDLPDLPAGFDGMIRISGSKIKILGIKVYSSRSVAEVRGEIRSPASGFLDASLSGKVKIVAETINKIFGLENKRDGELSVSGSIDLLSSDTLHGGSEGPKIKLDLKTKGWFYLETIMELFEVEDNISGRITLDGEISGIYPHLTGRGKVELEDAMLDTLHLDHASGEIQYKDNKLVTDNFTARTYEGGFTGNAYLTIPEGGYFVEADVKDVNSIQFFKFIEWEPPFPKGRINGSFHLTKVPGREIDLIAQADYLNTTEDGEYVEDRLETMKVDISMKDDVLTFHNAVLSSPISELCLDGTIDFIKERMDLNLQLDSRDVYDLAAPYFKGVHAPVKFKGKLEGPNENPVASGTVEAGPGTINGVPFTDIWGDLTYGAEFFSTRSLKVSHEDAVYGLSGTIQFRESTELFSFKSPFYRGEVLLENGNAEPLLIVAYRKLPISGIVNGKLSFEGDHKEFIGKGAITLKDGSAFGQSFNNADIKASLYPDNISFSSVEILKDGSKANGSGTVYFDERFNASISSENIDLKDVEIVGKYPFDANFKLEMKGSGTFKNPDIRFSLNVLESYFREAMIGKGDIKGELKGRELFLEGDLLNGTISADARALLTDDLPWDLNIELKKGRYDFLLAGFLKDVPRDLSASLEGSIRLKGDKDELSVDSRLSSLNFSLYGYNFKNKEDIVLEMSDETFTVKSFTVSGKNANLNAVGFIEIGRNYNMVVNGRIDLTPLKAVTGNIESLKGKGNFVVSISGPWDSPELNGEINVKNSIMRLAGLPYTIGPVNGSIFLDKDRIMFDSFSADFAGGTIVLSGAGHLDKFSLERLSIDSEMRGIKFRPVKDVNFAFDGNLFFEFTPEKRILLGDIDIKMARYEKRVDWKSWLVRLKEIKDTPMEQPSFLGDTELNVHIVGKDDIFIDNNIARTPVEIDLNVQGTFDQYGLIGRVDAEGGTIFFRGNDFKIISGNVDFVEVNRVVPIFHIQAETFTRGYDIRLNLDGPADKFALSLFSNPPLADMDILTLLTAGQVDTGSKGVEAGFGAGEATAFLTGGFQDVMEERVKYITGFERFEINPRTTATGAISPGITVGKRLLGEKLFVHYSTSVGTSEEHIVKLQYSLTKKLSLIGLRDEIGSIGGDIKYRFEFE